MKPKHIVLLIIDTASVVFFLCMTLAAYFTANSLPDQQAAKRWGGETKYAQISVYTDCYDEINIDSIFMARINVEKKLVENSISSEIEDARVWTDAFSSYQTSMTAASDHGSAEAAAIITGGDFFVFHPQDMISGYYYSDSDTMHDRIVIDDVLAWQLYGSSDIVGMPVIIDGKYFYVAGVFRQSENNDIKKVYGEKPRMFMSYQGYSLIHEEGAKFSCYEACLPDPVTGLGKQIISESISIDEKNYRIVENSSRYGLKNRFTMLADNNVRSVVDIPVVYPYWENAARMTEDRSVTLLIMQLAGLAAPVLTIVYLLRSLIKSRKKIFEKMREKINDIEIKNRSKRVEKRTALAEKKKAAAKS